MAMIHEFDPQIYPRLIWVMIGGSERDIMWRFYNCDRTPFLEADFRTHDRSAMCAQVREKDTQLLGELIWFPKRSHCTGSIMAHEATHAAMDIFSDIDAEVDTNNQEPFAYLVGWIMRCINVAYRFKESK